MCAPLAKNRLGISFQAIPVVRHIFNLITRVRQCYLITRVALSCTAGTCMTKTSFRRKNTSPRHKPVEHTAVAVIPTVASVVTSIVIPTVVSTVISTVTETGAAVLTRSEQQGKRDGAAKESGRGRGEWHCG